MSYIPPFPPRDKKTGKNPSQRAKERSPLFDSPMTEEKIEKNSPKKLLSANINCPSTFEGKKEKKEIERIKDTRLKICQKRSSAKGIRIPKRYLPFFPKTNCQLFPRNLLTDRVGDQKVFEGHFLVAIPDSISPRMIHTQNGIQRSRYFTKKNGKGKKKENNE